MDPFTLSAIIGGASSVLKIGSQLGTNASNRKYALEMYDRQRADALADWNRQNQYNSPAAVMQRYKQAGLSPHLIYGQVNNAPAIRSSSMDTPRNVAPQIDSKISELPILKLQMQNIEKQGKLMDAQALKTASEIENKKLMNQFLADSYGYRLDSVMETNLLNRSRRYLNEKQMDKIEADIRTIQPRINQLVAQTNLTREQQAQVSQNIKNLMISEKLTGEKVKTEEYLNSIQNKLQSMGIVGSTLAQILRLFK